jgi:hypothetical protein
MTPFSLGQVSTQLRSLRLPRQSVALSGPGITRGSPRSFASTSQLTGGKTKHLVNQSARTRGLQYSVTSSPPRPTLSISSASPWSQSHHHHPIGICRSMANATAHGSNHSTQKLFNGVQCQPTKTVAQQQPLQSRGDHALGSIYLPSQRIRWAKGSQYEQQRHSL